MGASEGVPGKLCRSTDLHRRSEGNGQHVVKLTVLLEKERKKERWFEVLGESSSEISEMFGSESGQAGEQVSLLGWQVTRRREERRRCSQQTFKSSGNTSAQSLPYGNDNLAGDH